MKESMINYIQGLEQKIGVKVSSKDEIAKMTEKAITEYLSYLENNFKKDTGNFLH